MEINRSRPRRVHAVPSILGRSRRLRMGGEPETLEVELGLRRRIGSARVAQSRATTSERREARGELRTSVPCTAAIRTRDETIGRASSAAHVTNVCVLSAHARAHARARPRARSRVCFARRTDVRTLSS